jgi:cyclic beta-1,2-glucan synthetase
MTPLARLRSWGVLASYLAPPSPGLRSEIQRLLDPSRGPLQAPVRAELFGVERFRQHGASLARAQRVAAVAGWRWRGGRQTFFPRLRANMQALELARSYLESLDRHGESRGLAGEWLLDNFHLIESQATEIRNALPQGYYRALPKLVDPPLTGMPRVYGIAWAFVAHTDSNFDAELLCQFLLAYQEVDTLTLGELWAIPVTLRVVLLENLARLADGVTRHRAAQQAADWCCGQREDSVPQHLKTRHAGLGDEALKSSFLAQLALRLRGATPEEAGGSSAWLAEQAAEADTLIAAVQDGYAADNVSVSNAVKALHAIDRVNWQDLIEQVSPVLQTLKLSTGFTAESDLTRDQCTHAVERFARRLKLSEADVARAVLHMPFAPGEAADHGPAHWLLGPGRSGLMEALGHPGTSPEGPWLHAMRRLRGPMYAVLPLVGTLWLVQRLFQGQDAVHSSVQWLAVAAALLVGFECLITLLNRVLAETIRVHRLPRLALDQGLTEELRTLVVVPCMLTSLPGVRDLVQTLERHYLANPEQHTRFALLSDWRDAAAERTEQDDELLIAAREGIEALNHKHPRDGADAPRFVLLHRERVWCEGEGVWMGWERKRGKIEQLLRLLAVGEDAGEGGQASPFVDLGPMSHAGQGVRYLMVLDSDTEMPPCTLREMVSIAAHPLNRPHLDPKTRRVTAGYGIFQPRIAAGLPRRGEITAFGWLFAAPWGFDVYNAGSSEIYQDLFSQGSFTGKGLLDVQAVHASLQGRTPPDQLLSHDLYEGIWAGAAHLSDVVLIEQDPMLPEVAAARSHRWTRGDWQLLSLLIPALRGRLGVLNLWKVIDNLRRSLLAPASLVLLWLSFATGALAPVKAVLLVTAAFGLGPLIGALAALFPGRSDLAWPHFLRGGAADLARALGGTLWRLVTLPGVAALQVDAIVRALWRMTISRQQRLEWVTAAQVQASARLDWAAFWRQHMGASLLAVAWVALGVWLPGASLPWLLGFGAVWALSPVWTWAASQPLFANEKTAAQDADMRRYLSQLARETWQFFEEVVTPADHHLPPDNLQLDPQPMLAHRTSPTNVGLYLASCLCARQLGLIDSAQMAQRLRATLDTLEDMPRWHGHFYNWTDTATRRPLGPRYVSTVDSGNLVACLWAVAQACQERASSEAATGAGNSHLPGALKELASRLKALADGTDFSCLYDRKRRLFHIGYRVEDASLDPAYYDLLASESRLTSFVAIAKGDVPPMHWQALGRPFLAVGNEPTLRSWSGSMFEYLMPLLLLREPDGGLLQRVSASAVRAQENFGAHLGIPWGVSECAYFQQDNQLAFQYGPFGVPQLALRRTPLEDRVVAPYASVLSLMVDPVAALANLHALERQGARDRYGFIEALDFSTSRLDEEGARRRVFTYMAHHQGMSLLSLCNLLCSGAPQGWFERVPQVQACHSLMHERLPREIVYQAGAIPRPLQRAGEDHPVATIREIDPAAAFQDGMPTVLLGNGSYSVNLRPNGSGQSAWRGLAINRFRDDLLRDRYGHALLLRRTGDTEFGSLTLEPHPHPDARYATRFFEERAEFDAHTPAWESKVTVWVSPDDAVELREVSLHNLGDEASDVELLSLFEVAMAPQRADEAHPAFSKLFVHAHAAGPGCLLLQRQPRAEGERSIWVAHFLASSPLSLEPADVQVECSRSRLLSRRGGAVAAPDDEPDGGDPQAELDTGLDPVASLRMRLRLDGHARVKLVVATAAAEDAATLMAIVDEYRQQVHVTRSLLKSAALARIRRRELRLEANDARAVQDLATAIALSRSRQRPVAEVALDRRALWRHSISGDRPIALIRIRDAQGLTAVRTLLMAQRQWAIGGLICDVVILDTEATSYVMPLHAQLTQMRDSVGNDPHPDTERGGVFILRQTDVSSNEAAALHAMARIDFVANGPSLERLMVRAEASEALRAQRHGKGDDANRPGAAVGVPRAHDAVPPRPQSLARGRFIEDGQAYEIRVDETHSTPRPWANVIGNPQFGCLVTESGGGFTWARNSRMNQLTPWSNDPVLDPAGEHYWVHDLDSGEVFGLLPSCDRNGARGYRVVHRAGMSSFEQQRGDLDIACSVAVHPQESAKCLGLHLVNQGARPRRLRLVAMVEWVMGAQRRDRMTLLSEYCPDVQSVLARQMEHDGGFGEGTALLMLTGLAVSQWSCDRREFFDRSGRLQLPLQMSGNHGFGLDPCGALAADVELAGGATLEMQWVLGYATSRSAAVSLAQRLLEPGELAQLPKRVQAHWDGLLSAVTVKSPDPAFDALVNRWLLYQTLSCRLWARAGFYQASGATGFRDQLQDVLALSGVRPDLLRAQLLLHASRQFLPGDVQHWWHAPTGVGVRTRFSDDLLWLPYAAHHYGNVTGDWALLDEPVSFLEGADLSEGAEDAYFLPTDSGVRESLFEHAARAIDHALRMGQHGLPLMGSGDWNDGMNRVGHEGRGESVWLAMFLLVILKDWVPLANQRGQHDRADAWAAASTGLETALNANGWDGAWFRRAYFDNGHVLGSHDNPECRIDLIAQAWSVFALPAGDERALQAMRSADAELVDRSAGLIRLLTPPLHDSPDRAGYIQAYPPGVRENGGQYSHGAVWAVIAQAELGHAEQAWAYFQMLSPAHRAASPEQQQRYGLEPYVMAGDVCSAPPYTGRGGWSWYTGSSAWMYRAAVEHLIGLRMEASRFCLRPCLPPAWPGLLLRLALRGRSIEVQLRRSAGADPHSAEAAMDAEREVSAGTWIDFETLPARCRIVVYIGSASA